MDKPPLSCYPASMSGVGAFVRKFADDISCLSALAAMKWAGGFVCAKCKHDKAHHLTCRPRIYECAKCSHQNSVTAGTVFHKTRTGIHKWFLAAYMIATEKRGCSAMRISKELEVSYPTAWLIRHKIREAKFERTGFELKNFIETDETFYGGYRQGGARAEVTEKAEMPTLTGFIQRNVVRGTRILTDGLKGCASRARKVEFGRFFTVNDTWKSSVVSRFIGAPKLVVDPFAGGGDLLKHFPVSRGYDIDPALGWHQNDSLRAIPRHDDAICVTNPPYLSKNSATRKKLDGAASYLAQSQYDDLYEIAIHRCLLSFEKVVAIIPETFTTTKRFKERLVAVDIQEKNPFSDTECPVLVACWGPDAQPDFDVYKNGEFIGPFSQIDSHGLFPKQGVPVRFNVKGGNVGLIGIDGLGPDDKIRFCDPDEISDDEIKMSSRTRSKLHVDSVACIKALIKRANAILADYRAKTADICLSPFKNNTREGSRRRRLDFELAKGIVWQALAGAQ